jgi:hypothetical protein
MLSRIPAGFDCPISRSGNSGKIGGFVGAIALATRRDFPKAGAAATGIVFCGCG